MRRGPSDRNEALVAEQAAEKILAMLREPEYVRLGAYELPDNPGRLCIPAKALREWARSSPAGDGPAA